MPAQGSASGSGMCIEYFEARKGLVVLGAQLRIFGDERRTWETLGNSPDDGCHSLLSHKPFRGEVLLGGGNNNRSVVARLDKDGSIERRKDFSLELGVRSEKLSVNPVSGRWPLLHRDRRLYEFDSDKDKYRLVDDLTKTA
jgi:hypothetical protein